MELQQKPQRRNDLAFVLGNGKSRLNTDPQKLKQHGTVYGCNALYREFDPDVLIAVDVKMINEIIESGYAKDHEVWTNPNKGIKTKNFINFFNPHKGWSSGPTALHLAATRNYKIIYILGFDYAGINGKFNNVYADTYNYKKSSDAPTFHGNWLSQTEKTIKEFKLVKFIRVVEPGAFMPDQLGFQHPNLKHIEYKEFNSQFDCAVKIS